VNLSARAWLVAAIAGIACAGGDSGSVPRVAIGSPAPAYSAVRLGGDSISLDSLRGRVVLLNIWATWCHPCREEIPVLEALHERHVARGLEVIGVSVDAGGEQAAVRAFANDMGMRYPIWHDPEERVSTTFLAVGVPATYLIDRGGALRWRKIGPITASDTSLTRALEAALGSS
jgi:thiol-disulfide isomerase/thioredoxin